MPPTITHRIAATFTPARDDQVPLAAAYPDRLSQDGGTVHIAQREPIVIGPPIQGDDWVAFNACCTVSQHRGSLLPLAGRVNATERYAIDWVRFDLTAPVRAENPVTVSEQHVPGRRPRHHCPDESQHDRLLRPCDSST